MNILNLSSVSAKFGVFFSQAYGDLINGVVPIGAQIYTQ